MKTGQLTDLAHAKLPNPAQLPQSIIDPQPQLEKKPLPQSVPTTTTNDNFIKQEKLVSTLIDIPNEEGGSTRAIVEAYAKVR